MAKYAGLTDAQDAAITNIAERHLIGGDRYVDTKIRNLGADPDDVQLPNATLTEMAAFWALSLAALDGSMGENSPLKDKVAQYERKAEMLAKTLTLAALGIYTPEGSGAGYFSLGRG